MASHEQSAVVVIVSSDVAAGLHFKCFQSSTNSESVLSFVHIRSMDLHFPCTPFYISVSGIGRLTANSHYVTLILLSSAGSNKKKEHWSRNPVSIVPSATVEMPSLWTLSTCQYSSSLSFSTPPSPFCSTRGEPPACGHCRDLKKGTHSVSTMSADVSVRCGWHFD